MLMHRARLPIGREFGGTSCITAEPAATIHPSPTLSTGSRGRASTRAGSPRRRRPSTKAPDRVSAGRLEPQSVSVPQRGAAEWAGSRLPQGHAAKSRFRREGERRARSWLTASPLRPCRQWRWGRSPPSGAEPGTSRSVPADEELLSMIFTTRPMRALGPIRPSDWASREPPLSMRAPRPL
jgi:hypothetical protein